MKSKPGYVFDSNVVVSAVLFHQGKPAQAVEAALDSGEILVSEDIVRELNDVLSRPKFERYASEEDRVRFLQSLLQEARLIEVVETIQACRDPKDNKYLEAAVGGGAECIVSGDDDLLVLHPFREIPILRPREFLDRLQGRTPQKEA
ncbi:MAG: putative toxin-antitoxin system toxin component, PIN family [Rhodothermales bacterium]